MPHLSRVDTLGVLSGSLAHELNQPLGIILSNAQAAQRMLAQEHPDLGELRDILNDIISEDRRAGDVIKRLRALLQRGETQSQRLEINECLNEVLCLVRGDLIGREVAIECALTDPLPPVIMDRVQLQQVILNLIVNACDAMESLPPDQRRLTVRTELCHQQVQLAVQDRGCGLPPDAEPLFQPFHTTKPHGLGLGLAICRAIVTAHRGRIWGEPGPGGGAIFRVALPVGESLNQ